MRPLFTSKGVISQNLEHIEHLVVDNSCQNQRTTVGKWSMKKPPIASELTGQLWPIEALHVRAMYCTCHVEYL